MLRGLLSRLRGFLRSSISSRNTDLNFEAINKEFISIYRLYSSETVFREEVVRNWIGNIEIARNLIAPGTVENLEEICLLRGVADLPPGMKSRVEALLEREWKAIELIKHAESFDALYAAMEMSGWGEYIRTTERERSLLWWGLEDRLRNREFWDHFLGLPLLGETIADLLTAQYQQQHAVQSVG